MASAGAPNGGRIADLARAKGQFIPLKTIVSEDWRGGNVLLGYGQSWALFRMLIQERPQAMRAYMATVRERRTEDYRLEDFRQAFGELETVEQRYFAYMRKLVENHK